MAGKILGIGLSRTGTSSLARALGLLGYSVVHFPTRLEQVARHDAAADITVAYTFPQLDQRFPGSRFVLTVRDQASWLRSCERFWQVRSAERISPFIRQVRKRVYGGVGFDADRFSRAWDGHMERIDAHFRNRQQDHLVVDICAGDGWESLCPFLGKPVPEMPFPHRNDSATLDALVLRVADATGEDALAERLVGLPEGHVAYLRRTDGDAASDDRTPILAGWGLLSESALGRVAGHFGGAHETAEALGVPLKAVEAALSRFRDRSG